MLGFELTPGNVHDSVSFLGIYEKVKKEHSNVNGIVVDLGYKIPVIAKQIIDDRKTLIIPNNPILKYSTTNRDGYKEYKNNMQACLGRIHGESRRYQTYKRYERNLYVTKSNN
ncbi:hypothetical protein J4G49_12950 [Clostridium neonatale]|nr:hypothetical protein [Clostridium neonatale]MBP8313565.1 hypothetical protein [Clostridium neonatale]